MAQNVGSILNLNNLAPLNFVFENRSSAPTVGLVAGRAYWDITAGGLRVYDGTGFSLKATDSALLQGNNAAFYLNRGNHTGTQTSATISDFAAAVRANTLDTMAAPVADLNLNNRVLHNLADGTLDTDAASRGYVKAQVASAAAGIDSKASVRYIVLVNDTLTGLSARAEGTPVAGDRILVVGQTDATKNGVYVAASGGWSRATDADENYELTPGAFWYVEEGANYAKTQWRIENTGTISVGATNIIIHQFGAAQLYTNGNGLNLTGSTFSVKAAAGVVVTAAGVGIDTTVVVQKGAVTSIGDGTASSFTVTHNLNNTCPQVAIRDTAGNQWIVANAAPNANQITISFDFVPTANQFVVEIQG